MLKRIGNHTIDDTAVRIAEADFPQPKPWTLEYCPPVYESWNIVHIGMLLPEAHQIYVCADNCMRGVTMTAAEMGQADRFHCVIIEEKDMLYALSSSLSAGAALLYTGSVVSGSAGAEAIVSAPRGTLGAISSRTG